MEPAHCVQLADGRPATYDGAVITGTPDELTRIGPMLDGARVARLFDVVPRDGATVLTLDVAEWDARERARTGPPTRLERGTPDWLDAFATLTRVAILRHFGPRSCIGSARVGIEVLNYFGLVARALPVRVFALSPDAAAWHDAHPAADEMSPVGWSVGVGGNGEGEPGDWDGHLVLTHQRGPLRYLIDLSADQLHRPDHDLHVPGPVVVELPARYWDVSSGPAVYGREDGSVIGYLPLTGRHVREYTESSNWRRTNPGVRAAVGQAVIAVRAVTA